MLGCLVMVSSATAKAVFEEWGGLRAGAFAGHPASHRQAVRVEEEIVDAHREDAVFVADGFDHVAYEDDLLEAVVDLEQRGLLLRDLLRWAVGMRIECSSAGCRFVRGGIVCRLLSAVV